MEVESTAHRAWGKEEQKLGSGEAGKVRGRKAEGSKLKAVKMMDVAGD